VITEYGHKVVQATLLFFSLYMLCGFGVSWRDTLPSGVVKTTTYTLYRTVPPPPEGPRFCQLVDMGKYGAVGPCNFVPPFIWWLEKRYREKNYTIKL
jgi:hypothetical protein